MGSGVLWNLEWTQKIPNPKSPQNLRNTLFDQMNAWACQHRLSNREINQSIIYSFNELINQSINWSINQLINWLVNQSIKQSIKTTIIWPYTAGTHLHLACLQTDLNDRSKPCKWFTLHISLFNIPQQHGCNGCEEHHLNSPVLWAGLIRRAHSATDISNMNHFQPMAEQNLKHHMKRY